MKNEPLESAAIVIIGAGAAGLMAGIWAGRSNPKQRIVILDGAKKIGAKILVAGGGRCNVTHDEVHPEAYSGTSRNAIKKVLRRFDVPQTVNFFREIGIELKREATGKLFPVTDEARTVLNALLRAINDAGVRIHNPHRVEQIQKHKTGFTVSGAWGSIHANKVVLATGGKSLPKSGSDGFGYELAKALGHTVTERVFPALVPLILPGGHFLRSFGGITVNATLEVRSGSGKKIAAFTDSTLCTHFGLSGPSVLDISRYFINARMEDPSAQLVVNWIPQLTPETFDSLLQSSGRVSVGRIVSEYLPERLARALCVEAGIEPATLVDQLRREQRKALVRTVTELVVPIMGNRGFTYAEVTAGGVPLTEIVLETMESRLCPNLYFCGEICDVDGRIGGYNFQWAWSSGYVVGVSL